MSWTPLPKGAFTSIDWSKPDNTRGADPYLVWAETDSFAGFGGTKPKWLPLAMELKPGCTIAQLLAAASDAWLRVPAAYSQGGSLAALRFCTARVRPQFFKELQAGGKLHAIVKRVELGLPARTDADDFTREPRHREPATSQAMPEDDRKRADQLLTGKVLGLIDDSLALAHANFLDAAGQPRTAFFWRQDDDGFGRQPADMGYGHELTSADIRAAMDACRSGGVVNEGAVYVALGLSTMGQVWPGGRVPFHALDTRASHGTHVMDLFGGPRTLLAQQADLPPDFSSPASWALAGDAASASPIVAVQLDYDTVKDTSGGSMNVHVLDGLLFILSRCDPSAKVAVNISFGTLAGPHDGTSLLEAAMDQLLTLCKGRLEIVLAAGNSYQLRTHANVALQPNTTESLHWRVLPDDSTQSFLELWIEKGCEGVSIEVQPPGRDPLPPLAWGQSMMWLDGGSSPLCALIYPQAVATGDNGTCALLALAPTFSFDAKDATAPAGVWRIGLTNAGPARAIVDGYIERDDVVIGTRSGARQSHFEDAPHYPDDMQYDMAAFVDDPKRTTPIRRSGNFNSIATGTATTSVGGVLVTRPQDWARYSPLQPDPDAARPERPGVVKVPRSQSFSDVHRSQPGVPAAGTRSGATVRLAGTSAASPQVARDKLNSM